MQEKKKVWYLRISFWIGVTIIGIFIIPLVLNQLFVRVFNMSIEFSVGDAMEYYAAIIGFLASAAVGIIALYQNVVFKNENDKLMKLQNAPYFSFVKLEDLNIEEIENKNGEEIDRKVYGSDTKTLKKITFKMKNISKYPICNVSMKTQVFNIQKKEWINLFENEKVVDMVIEPNESKEETTEVVPIWYDNICQAAFPNCSKNVFAVVIKFTNSFGLDTYGRIVLFKDEREPIYRMIPLYGMLENEVEDEVSITKND